MKNRITLLLIAILSVLMLTGFTNDVLAAGKGPMDLVGEAKAKISEMTPQQVKADLDAGKSLILLDVRGLEEYEAGHLPKAMHISRGLLEFKIGAMIPDRGANIVLYCRTGARSALATAVLQEMGYANVKNMNGAFKAWGEAGYPIFNRHGEFTMNAFEKKE
jgi:rhodanese-related sulfurtransferase